MKILLLTTVVLWLATSAQAAEIKQVHEQRLLLSGEIQPGDYNSFVEAYEALKSKLADKNSLIWIQLDSPGGDVREAIRIGEYLRDNKIAADVGYVVYKDYDDICYSSCVLILLGGVTREVYGIVGLHAPFTDASLTREEVKSIRTYIRQYLARMEISDRVFDLIFNTQPYDLVKLSSVFITGSKDDERVMKELNIIGMDATYAEEALERGAKAAGVSKSEHIRRTSMSQNCFEVAKSSAQMFACMDFLEATNYAHMPSHDLLVKLTGGK